LAGGNITIDPIVGDLSDADITAANYLPHLEGIFLAQGIFDTSPIGWWADRQLRIDGTVIGLNGVVLRSTSRGATGNPGLFFNFRPDLTVKLMQVGLRRKASQELLPP
jgi:hypothetical protein